MPKNEVPCAWFFYSFALTGEKGVSKEASPGPKAVMTRFGLERPEEVPSQASRDISLPFAVDISDR
jgi:hypothetical protein